MKKVTTCFLKSGGNLRHYFPS